jgi:hypothetical protein
LQCNVNWIGLKFLKLSSNTFIEWNLNSIQ